MEAVSIEFIKEEEIDQLIPLCALHSEYERVPFDPTGKEENLRRFLFNENPALYCLVAKKEGVMVGYASYMIQFSTWDASQYIYMDCLFLLEFHRGFGIGQQLMERIEEEAKKISIKEIQWQTPEFNTRAIKFYNRIGGHSKSKERYFFEVVKTT
ncbi:GNAT family N-acetyltransferase [Flavobacteriaceae bacterium]|nr:GNAT family N-acetyltransferase [Flavobacteriaceae bacterium]MDA9015188.1 GNAT family N-acetyltransferase [Flavobacteriaceae bacterium]MDB3862093.1 GNAT family N-acetyltransferase [Flavobacteriaceae bacterium]MDC3354402.1 GNAT family N-acetyltransferase [Flavobacteriaceae bacterium]